MVYTMGATIVMQIVLQIILYPVLNKVFGEDTTGTILYFMGIVYIFPQAVGTALCNTRLISRKTMETTNGDYSKILVVSSVVSAAICFAIAFKEERSWVFSIAFALFTIVYAFRMYALVEFRLKLQFKGYFIYHAIVSVGYLIGMGIYFLVHQWLIIFFVGELMGLGYSLIKGDIFKKEKPIGNFKSNLKNNIMLLISVLLRDGVNQYDKVIIFTILSSNLVTQYNALSLIGKSMQMLINPVNTLIVSYLSAKDANMTKSKFRKFTLISLGAGVVLLLACQIGTPIYIKLFYSSFYDKAITFCFFINCGLILGFVASLFMATVMSQGKTTIYTIVQFVWGVLYISLAYVLTKKFEIMGLAWTGIIVNGMKLIAAIIIARLTCISENTSSEKVVEENE